MVVTDGEILEKDSGVEVKPSPGKRSGILIKVPAEKSIAAGSYATEGIPTAGDDGEGDIWVNKNGLTATEAENPLRGLLSDDAADGGGTVADSKRGGRAES